MSSQAGPPPGGDPYGAAGGPVEDEEMQAARAAYEAELSRIHVSDMLMQSAVSLLNLAARRLAPDAPDTAGEAGAAGAGAGAGEAGAGAPVSGGRDLDQAADAIDGVRALLDILERRMPGELGPLRDALSRLQLAYAAEMRAGAAAADAAAAQQADPGPEPPGKQGGEGGQDPGQEQPKTPGPAESSGRLWVPGR